MFLTSGSNESISTILKSLAFELLVALRGMPACFPTGGGTAEWGETEARWNLCHRVSVGAPPGRTLLRKSQKTRAATFIADGAPTSRWPGFFQAVVCRGLSRRTVRLTSDSQRSNAILDEDPRKESRAKCQKASQKSCHPLPTSATFCTLGAPAHEIQTQSWPGFTIVRAAPAAVYQRNSAFTKPDAAPFGQRGTGRNMVIALMSHGSGGGYDSDWLNFTLLLNHADVC